MYYFSNYREGIHEYWQNYFLPDNVIHAEI